MTTITREHLELAAKAAKEHVICIPDKATGELVVHHQPGAFWQPWRPYFDPADAWQLAADCAMEVNFDIEHVKVRIRGRDYVCKDFGDGIGRTAMEAVTLAAAEIGRAMG